MASAADIVNTILNLDEQQFFAADDSVLAPREARLLDTDFTGIAVNAPRRVPIARRDKLPLLLAVRSDGRRDWDVPLRDNAILVGVNLGDGSVVLADALATEKDRETRGGRERRRRGPAPAQLAEESAQITALDARAQLRMDWAPSTWALAVLNFDWPSNVVTVALEGDRPPASVPARIVSPAPNPACGADPNALPCYVPLPGGAPAPASGASFTVTLRADRSPQLHVRGAFTVKLRERHLAPPGLVHQLANGRRETVAAIVPITLALTRLDGGRGQPIQFDWAVPVYGTNAQPGTAAAGYFAIDALAGRNAGLPSGRYAAYLVIDDTISGPQRLEVGAR